MRLWARRARPQGKGITYARLISAFDETGCPVCLLVARGVRHFLDSLSYEQVNDPGVRARLRTSRGFCNLHAWQFVEQIRDGLGTAIIYADIIGGVLVPLRAALPRNHISLREHLLGWWRSNGQDIGARLARRLMPTDECPACTTVEATTRAHIDTLLAHAGERELRNRYLQGSGLCLPHLHTALGHGATAGVARLLRDHARQRWQLPGSDQQPGWANRTATAAMQIGLRSVTQPHARSVWPSPPGGAPARVDETASPDGSTTGCPVCQAGLLSVDRRLKWLVVQAPPPSLSCNPMVASLDGICNEHAWQLLDEFSPAEIRACLEERGADLARRLAGECDARSSHLQASVVLRHCLRAAVGDRPRLSTNGCSICVARQCGEGREAARLAATLGSHPSDAPDLCLPHLTLMLQSGNQAASAALLTAAVPSLITLKRELDEYIRRQDYHFAGEPLARLGDAPWRAVARVAGARGLMGTVKR